MAIKRVRPNTNQMFRTAEWERLAKLPEQQIGTILHMLFSDQADGDPVTDRVAIYFGDSGLVEYVSGDRSVGLSFRVKAGLGWKWKPTDVTDIDATIFEPIYLATDYSIPALAPSDDTNPRIDRVFMRPKLVAENAQDIGVIVNPTTETIEIQSKEVDNAWRFEVIVATGTPASTPALPAVPEGWDSEDELALIVVQPGSGGFDTGDLTDIRRVAKLSKSIYQPPDTLAASAISLSPSAFGQTNVQAALQAAQTTSSLANVGLLVGSLEYTSTTTATLKRGYGGKIAVEINGTTLVRSGSDLAFTLPSALIGVESEAPSTLYYLYVQSSGGQMLARMSATAPNANGYHPSQATYRCIGAVYNDSSSNLVPFDPMPNGETYFRSRYRYSNSALLFSPGTTLGARPTAWTEINLSSVVPTFAKSVVVESLVRGQSMRIGYGPRNLVGTSNTPLFVLEQGSNDANERFSMVMEIPLTTAGRIAWRIEAAVLNNATGGHDLEDHQLRVLGW